MDIDPFASASVRFPTKPQQAHINQRIKEKDEQAKAGVESAGVYQLKLEEAITLDPSTQQVLTVLWPTSQVPMTDYVFEFSPILARQEGLIGVQLVLSPPINLPASEIVIINPKKHYIHITKNTVMGTATAI